VKAGGCVRAINWRTATCARGALKFFVGKFCGGTQIFVVPANAGMLLHHWLCWRRASVRERKTKTDLGARGSYSFGRISSACRECLFAPTCVALLATGVVYVTLEALKGAGFAVRLDQYLAAKRRFDPRYSLHL